MATPKPVVTALITSETIHNNNCYAYLKKLTIPESVLARIRKIDPALALSLAAVQKETSYNPSFPYADLYTKFFTVVEDHIEKIFDELHNKSSHTPEEEAQLRDLDTFIFSIYDNDNEILESTFAAIQHIPLNFGPVNPSIEETITSHLRDKGTRINVHTQTPAEAGSAYGRASAFIAANFKPQHTTSLATVRKYGYKENPDEERSSLREYRFGTQGQRHEGKERVSPLFERWLQVQRRKHAGSVVSGQPARITHIYFNNLGLDRKSMEGKKERALTLALHTLESKHSNIAVITLPADKGLMEQWDFKDTEPVHAYEDVYKEFLDIASQDKASTQKVKDFYISDNIRKRVFCDSLGNYDKEIEKAQIKILLNRSFEALGIRSEGATLSPAQKQAVWFHFIKFELPNHIIARLNPESVNFSCKDAIDRGGVSSCYFNLMKSIEAGHPMTRIEFERGLHAAPTLVKARGINHHSKLIWNAVDAYITANYDKVRENPNLRWLIEWRDLNCPHARVSELLTVRVEQVKTELRDRKETLASDDPRRGLIDRSVEMFDRIEAQHAMGASGKRLLLETVTRTPQILFGSSQDDLDRNLARYQELEKKLSIKYPRLQIVVGVMKSLVGAVLSFTSIGKEWYKAGLATAAAGWDAGRRGEIKEHMRELKAQVADRKSPPATSPTPQATEEDDHSDESPHPSS